MYPACTFQSWRSSLTMLLLLRPLVEREAAGKGAQQILSARGSKRGLLRWGRAAGSRGWQQGQWGRGLTDRSAEQVCWWQPGLAKSPGGQGMRQIQGQAWHHSESRSTGIIDRNKGESLSLKPAPGRRSSRPSLRFLLALSFKATRYTVPKPALNPGSQSPRMEDAHGTLTHQPFLQTNIYFLSPLHSQTLFLFLLLVYPIHSLTSHASSLMVL